MISLITQRFYYPDYSYSGTAYTDFLFGSIGDKVRAETTFEVHWETLDTNMTFLASDDSIERNDGNSFVADGFKTGDTIVITGTASNNTTTTISSISDDGTIIYVAAALVNETVNANIYGETPVTALDFFPNICENDNTTFFDLTDRNTSPRFYVTGYSTPSGTKNMTVGSNSIGWLTGIDGTTNGCTIDGISFSNHRQRFTIKHTFLITPVYIAGELTNLQNGLPPASTNLRDRRTLKYICQIFAKYTNYDPVIPHTASFTEIRGNTGWFDEFINGNESDYWFESIRITKGSNEIDAIEYCSPINCEIKLMSHGKFVTGHERKFILNIMWLPQNESDYIDKRTDWKRNFIFERAKPTMSVGGTVQGENVSGDYHFLKDITATRISDNEARVNFTVEYSDTIIDFFDRRDLTDLNYLIWVTTEDGLMASPLNGDRTAILCEVDSYTCDKDDTTLFQIIDAVNFYEYPNCTGIGYTEVRGYARDTWLSVTQFHFKKGGLAKNISAKIIAFNSVTEESFELEKYTIDLSQYKPNCEQIQEIDFIEANQYNLPDGSCLGATRLMRMPTLDIYGYNAYEFRYPFKLRWEEWQSVFPSNDCFPSPTQNWIIYQQINNWAIKFVIEANVEGRRKDDYAEDPKLRHTTNFQHFSNVIIKDPCNDTTAVELKTYKSGVDIDDLIDSEANTTVEVIFKGEFANYSASNLYGIGYLDAPNIGGVNYIYQISTEEDNEDTDVLQGLSGGTRATLTKVDDSTITLKWEVAYQYIPNDADQFQLYARLGYKPSTFSSSGTCPFEINSINFECSQFNIIEVESAEILVVTGFVETEDERNVPVQDMRLERITNKTWKILSGGVLGRDNILSGTVSTNSNNYPIHPYTDDLVDEQIAGTISGTANTSDINLNGIGDMQIGCTFFVS